LLATQIGALAIGAPAYAFMDIHWSKEHFPMLAGKQAYLDMISRIALANLPSSSVALGLAAANASLGRNWGTAAAIEFAYANAVPEEHLLEALSLVIWPSGVNRFVDACETWHELMADGVVEPSERFRIWAETPGQKGFSDKASPD
jgi:alkylhydroperoxidase/carboxymuconolactone decarboxylase family protein YurZ